MGTFRSHSMCICACVCAC